MRRARDGGEIVVSRSTVVNKSFLFALAMRILQELQAVSRCKFNPTIFLKLEGESWA